MRKVCRDYAEIFDEIEESPSCHIYWKLSDRSVICKPQFIPQDTRKRVQPDAAKSEDEPIKADAVLPSVEKTGDDESSSVSSRLDGTWHSCYVYITFSLK